MEHLLRSIMLVDDSQDVRELARISLEQVGGFTVYICDSGESALKLAETVTPDLLLLDVMMPEMDGPELLQALKQRDNFAAVPVVFLTAIEDKSELEAFKPLGVVAVIGKPFNPVSLPDRIREVWQATQKN
ncbi:MAG: response regulator [Gammaproteobacteria bacterium]